MYICIYVRDNIYVGGDAGSYYISTTVKKGE